jgi:hypothetical protein
MNIILAFLGLAVFIYGVCIRIRIMGRYRVANLPFSPGPHEFQMTEPGYYSISILRAGKVTDSAVVVNLSINNLPGSISYNLINPRYRHSEYIATSCWGFTTERTGHCLLSFQNLETVEAYNSITVLGQITERPISFDRLRILIHKDVTPIKNFIGIVCTVVGALIAAFSILEIINTVAY